MAFSMRGGEDPPGDPTAGPSPSGAAGAVPGVLARDAARARARLLLFGSAVFFGLTAVLARLAARGGMNGGQVTLVRFSFGIAAIVALFVTRPGTFRPRRPGLLAVRALFGAVAGLMYFLAIERIPAGEATLLNNTFPIWAVLLSLVVLNERPTIHLAAALVMATLGVSLVLGGNGPWLGLRLGVGEVLGVASGLFGGVAVTAIRALRRTDNAPTIFFSFSLGGLALSVPFAFGPWPSSPLPWLVALAVGVTALLAQLFMTEAYGALSVPEAALWQQLTPAASYLWALGIGERIGWVTMLGVFLGIAGIFYGSVLGHRPRVARSEEARLAEGLPAEEP